jgi:poly-gamma-glutamate capsule biosynthesis protein CapA/YwtB (metallophosphatase superfamily)
MTPVATQPVADAMPPATESKPLREQAAAGYFRAIALWLNQDLVEQGLYAQVQAASPGCLQVRVEYERPPVADELSRLICHRIWHLNSPLIEGIQLSVRPVGGTHTDWARRIRIVSPALRQRQAQRERLHRQSSLPPRLKPPQPQPSRHLPQQTAKTFRALLISGSAVAAFILGCLMEVLLSAHPSPMLPIPKQASVTPSVEAVPVVATGTPLPARPDDRDPVVNAALEPVAVIAHEQVPSPADPTITLVFGGEVDLDEVPYTSLTEQLLAGVDAYQQADVAMVSLNNSLATAATTLDENFIDRQRPDAVALLKQEGIDIVDLAGEDTMAFGEQGLAEALETLDRNGVYRVGAGRNEREARRPEILDVKGQRIAYLSYNQRELVAATGELGGINALDKAALVADIRALRPEVDWLVVNYRWSQDLPEQPADWQTNLARLAIDQGADVVIGHHPTQLQGTEVYKGRPIAYSLGDVLFDDAQGESPEASAVLQVSLGDRQMKVNLLPITMRNGRPEQAIGPEAEAILAKIQAASQAFPTPMAPSLVLDLQPQTAPTNPADGNFTEGDGPFIQEGVPAEYRPRQPLSPQEEWPNGEPVKGMEGEVPVDSNSDDFSAPEESLPVPEGLNQWGPKETPGQEQFVPIPEAGEALLPLPEQGPRPRPESAQTETPTMAPDRSPATIAPQPTPQVAPETVPAHSEPLVGPLAVTPSLDEAWSDVDMPDPVMDARARLGLPQTRVFKPLAAETHKQLQSAIPAATTLEQSP